MKKIFYTTIFILICLAGFGVAENAKADDTNCAPLTSNICQPIGSICPPERVITSDTYCQSAQNPQNWRQPEDSWKNYICCAPRKINVTGCADLAPGVGATCFTASASGNRCDTTKNAMIDSTVANLCPLHLEYADHTVDDPTGYGNFCCVPKCELQKNDAGEAGHCTNIINTTEESKYCPAGEEYLGIFDCLKQSWDTIFPSLQVCCRKTTSAGPSSGQLPGLLDCEDVIGATCKKNCATGETAYTINEGDVTVGNLVCPSDKPKCCLNPTNTKCSSPQNLKLAKKETYSYTGACKDACDNQTEIDLGLGFLDCYQRKTAETPGHFQSCCAPTASLTNANTNATPITTPPRIPLAGTYRGGTAVGFEGLKGFGNVKISVLIGRIIQSALGVIGALALLMVVYGGIILLSSRGGEGVKKGKDILTWSIIGVAVILGSYALVSFTLTGLGGGGVAPGDITSTGSFTGTAKGGTNTNATPATNAPAGADCLSQNGLCRNCTGYPTPLTEALKSECARNIIDTDSAQLHPLLDKCLPVVTGCGEGQICCIPIPTTAPGPTPDANGCFGTTAKGFTGCQPGGSPYNCCDCGAAGSGTEALTCKSGTGAGVVSHHCGKGSHYCRKP